MVLLYRFDLMLSDIGAFKKLTSLPQAEERIYQHIYQAIVERRLPPGTKLTEEVLADMFQANRRRIRSVLQQLAHDRCVELIPNRGAFVSQPSPKEAKDIFACRMILEQAIIDQVAHNFHINFKTQLLENTRAEAKAHLSGNRSAAIRLSGEFHLLLASFTNNQVILETLQGLITRSSLIIAMYGAGQPSTVLCSCDEHSHILESLEQGQTAQAHALMTEHLQRIEDQLVLEIKSSEPLDLWQALNAQS